MKCVLTEPSRSIREYRLLPGFTGRDTTMGNMSLKTRLCRRGEGFLHLNIPLVSAAMQAVTGTAMATALSALGGVGVLPLSASADEQCAAVRAVKRFKAGFQTEVITFAPDQPIGQVQQTIDQTGFRRFPVTDTGHSHGRLIGIITDKDFDQRRDQSVCVRERMTAMVQTGPEDMSLKQANEMMITAGRGCLPIVSKEGTLHSVVFRKDLNRHISHPQATVDGRKRHIVGAAVSTYEQDRHCIEALIKSEVDFLVLDASHGHTAYQQEALAWIKKYCDVPVIAGNVVTADGFYHLARSGADAVKIGMGIGSGCITQAVKSTGRGQATAIMEVAAARNVYLAETGTYVPLVADGGLISAAEIVLALAMGADTVMMGNFFARFSESPGPLLEARGQQVKAYWMEASAKALNYRRYYQSPATFFEEGISGFVPFEGSIYDALPQTLNKIKAALSTAGVCTIEDLQRTAVLERQSFAALNDAAVHNIQPEGQGGSFKG